MLKQKIQLLVARVLQEHWFPILQERYLYRQLPQEQLIVKGWLLLLFPPALRQAQTRKIGIQCLQVVVHYRVRQRLQRQRQLLLPIMLVRQELTVAKVLERQ